MILTVTVTDKKGRLIENMSPDHFTILHKDEPQKIEYFCPGETRSSIGILLDVSGSMIHRNNRDALLNLKEHILRFVQQSPASTEYFLMAFGERIQFVGWTSSAAVIKGGLGQVAVMKGATPLYDAIFTALEQFRERPDRKRVLLLITDGMDNNSNHRFDQTVKFLRESNVLVYGIDYLEVIGAVAAGLFEPGQAALTQFSKITGGSALFPRSPRELTAVFDAVASELRNQYSMGFRPTGVPDGKWRQIRVKVKPVEVRDPDKPRESPRMMELNARTREGYYAK
ncbi:MAG TPA: VWA domain-containing protein [Blastocatellia bacterium]|nr:VWA domain-containing protein [Blastocatellia bacterium]